jgi:acetate---CoA ligase (ADP-forming)
MYRLSAPLPAVDDVDARRLVLRDGSAAAVRPARQTDRESMRRFFREQSLESRRKRFFSLSEPPDAVLERLCESSDPERSFTLIAHRSVGGDTKLMAVGSYMALTNDVAEVAFAVDDQFQGRGLATLLIERLAVIAADAGFQRFQATTFADSTQMLEVLRDSGFEIRSKSSGGCIDVQLSLTPSFESVSTSEERNRIATAASLGPMLRPRAVAVIGVSREQGNMGRRVLNALTSGGFAGRIYPVTLGAGAIEGMKSFATVRELPSDVDLAVLAVPRGKVLDIVDDCAVAGVKSLVVITAGFGEADEQGRILEDQLVERIRSYGMRMVGPNCMGLLNVSPDIKLNASYAPIFPLSGPVALSSQAGALGVAILELAAERHVGLSTYVSVGNKADVSGNDLLEYWEGDRATSVILLYIESFGNPRRFARLARRIGRSKPIVVVKAGRTRPVWHPAGSHTAALAACDVAADALFRQSGVIRAATIDEMFDIAACLETQPLPCGRRVAIVTSAGGPGVLAVDACEAAGLTLTEFSVGTRTKLATCLPEAASVGNPVEIPASVGPEEYRQALEVVLTAEETDALIVMHTPIDLASARLSVDAIRQGVAAGRRAGATKKPILTCMMTEPEEPAPLVANGERIPRYRFPENAARALGKIAAYASWRAQPPGLLWGFDDVRVDEARAICRKALDTRSDGWLTSEEVRGVLSAFGMPLAAGAVAHTADEAAALASVLGFPVAAKLSSRRIQHKTEIGGVRLNLANESAVRKAFHEIVARARQFVAIETVDGVLVQPMIAGGVETMIGVADDPIFGALVGFGLGGIHVEILGDVRFRVAPLTDRDADELLHEIKGFPLLQGYRGHAPADIDALRDVLLRVSRLAEEITEIAELDLNPVVALPPGNGCRIVDARIRVGQRRRSSMGTSAPIGAFAAQSA